MTLENFIELPIILDFANKYISSPSLTAVAGDANGRKIRLTITDGGRVQDLTGKTVVFYWKNVTAGNSGMSTFTPADAKDGVFDLFFPTEMLVAGTVNANIQIVDSIAKTMITSRSLTITVEPSTYDAAATEAENNFDALQHLMTDKPDLAAYRAYINQVNGKANQSDLLSFEAETGNNLTLKANQTDLNATNANVTLNTANISANTSQISSLASGSPKAVPLVANMTDHTKNYVYTGSESGYTSGNWYYWSGSAWTSGGSYQSQGITDKSILRTKLSFDPSLGLTTDKLDFKTINGLVGKNLFDKTKITQNVYYLYHDGTLQSVSGFSTSNLIKVEPNTQYVLSGTNQQFTLWDADGNFIIGYAPSTTTFSTTSATKYVRLTFLTTDAYKVQLEKGAVATSYEAYRVVLEHPEVINSVSFVGKNLFDKTKTEQNTYYYYSTGEKRTQAEVSSSSLISVEPSTQYAISGTNQQFTLWDADGNFISGFAPNTTLFTTTASTKYVRLTFLTRDAGKVQLEKGTVATSYDSYKKLAPIIGTVTNGTTKLPEGSLPDSVIGLLSGQFTINGLVGKNLFDKTKITQNVYYLYHDGTLQSVSGFSTSNLIKVEPNTQYVLSGTNQQFTLWDADGNFISGFAPNTTLFTTTASTKYVRLTFLTRDAGKVQLEKGTVATSYDSYKKLAPIIGTVTNGTTKLPEGSLPDSVIGLLSGQFTIHVKTDGTGDFTSLVDAVRSIANVNDSTNIDTEGDSRQIYNVYIYDDHDIILELGGQSWIEAMPDDKVRRGLFIPKNVNLHGFGMPRIHGEILKTWTITNPLACVPGLEIYDGNNFIENLIIDVKNMRYAVHDESNGIAHDNLVHWKNCQFIHRGTSEFPNHWPMASAYGMGAGSGNKRIFENCSFTAAECYSSLCHDWGNAKSGVIWAAESCEFYNQGGNPTYQEDVRFSTYQDGTPINNAVINNSILRNIAILNEKGLVPNRWRLRGSGNSNSSLSEPNTSVPKTVSI